MIHENRAPVEQVGPEVGFFQGLLFALVVGSLFWALLLAFVLL
jgi:hypothetical protein